MESIFCHLSPTVVDRIVNGAQCFSSPVDCCSTLTGDQLEIKAPSGALKEHFVSLTYLPCIQMKTHMKRMVRLTQPSPVCRENIFFKERIKGQNILWNAAINRSIESEKLLLKI